MCVQDIKIGRTTEVTAFPLTDVHQTGVSICGPDADRIAVSIGYGVNTAMGATASFCIGIKINGSLVGICGLSSARPTHTVRIEDIGTAIQQELFAVSNFLTTQAVTVFTTRLRKELDKI